MPPFLCNKVNKSNKRKRDTHSFLHKFGISLAYLYLDWRRANFRSTIKEKNTFSFCIVLTYLYLDLRSSYCFARKYSNKFGISLAYL